MSKKNYLDFSLGRNICPIKHKSTASFFQPRTAGFQDLWNICLKNVEQFYLSDSAPQHSSKNTIAHRNLPSSVTQILTFTLLWCSQLQTISDFFLFPALPELSWYPRGNTSILYWAPIENFAALTDMIWLQPAKHSSATPLSVRQWVAVVIYCRKKAQPVSQIFLFIARFSAQSRTKQTAESNCMIWFVLNWTCHGATWQNTFHHTGFEGVSPLLHAHPLACWGKEKRGEGITTPPPL